jgi:hypothetical protein
MDNAGIQLPRYTVRIKFLPTALCIKLGELGKYSYSLVVPVAGS